MSFLSTAVSVLGKAPIGLPVPQDKVNEYTGGSRKEITTTLTMEDHVNDGTTYIMQNDTIPTTTKDQIRSLGQATFENLTERNNKYLILSNGTVHVSHVIPNSNGNYIMAVLRLSPKVIKYETENGTKERFGFGLHEYIYEYINNLETNMFEKNEYTEYEVNTEEFKKDLLNIGTYLITANKGKDNGPFDDAINDLVKEFEINTGDEWNYEDARNKYEESLTITQIEKPEDEAITFEYTIKEKTGKSGENYEIHEFSGSNGNILTFVFNKDNTLNGFTYHTSNTTSNVNHALEKDKLPTKIGKHLDLIKEQNFKLPIYLIELLESSTDNNRAEEE